MTTDLVEKFTAAAAQAGLAPAFEQLSILGQPLVGLARDDLQTWHDLGSAMVVTGFWTGDLAKEADSTEAQCIAARDLAEAEDRFYAASGLYACACLCECWLTDATPDGCGCEDCAGPHYEDVKRVEWEGKPGVLVLIPWTAVFRAMQFGPWSAEFFSALHASGLAANLMASVAGGERVEVDPAPLTGSPIAFLEDGAR